MKQLTSRLAGLILAVVITLTVSGWIPFTAPVTIHTYPAGAPVYKTGTDELVGTTPLSTFVFVKDQDYEIRMDKYEPHPIKLDHNSRKDLYIKLKPTPVLVYTKPSAEIFSAATGEKVGDTPIDMPVTLKSRDFIIKKEDYFNQKVTVGLESKNPLVIELQHRPLITITCEQDDVDIYENGLFISKAPLSGEIRTPRTFEFRKDKFFRKTLTLTPAQTHELNYQTSVSLEPHPTITIQASPASANIFIPGSSHSLGTGSATLQIGVDTDFVVKADRYYDETFTMKASGDQTATISLKPMPYITLSSSPSGAAVVIRGNKVGTTPMEWLAEKPVTAELQLDGYLPQTITISDSDMTPMITLEEEPPPPPPEPETNIAPVVVEEPIPEPAEIEEPEPGMSPLLLGGIAVAGIALIGIIAAVTKKKK